MIVQDWVYRSCNNKYLSTADGYVKEKVNGIVLVKMTSNLKQGIGITYYYTTRTLNTSYQAYETRVDAEAIQTDMNMEKTIPVLKNKIVMELEEIF